jgi:hypothetical protein
MSKQCRWVLVLYKSALKRIYILNILHHPLYTSIH